MSELPSLSVLERPGVRSLRVESPLPSSGAQWERFAQALHHACLGRRPGEGLILDLDGIADLNQEQVAGILWSVSTAMKTGSARCGIRIVCGSPEVRSLLERGRGLGLAVCATADEAVRSMVG